MKAENLVPTIFVRRQLGSFIEDKVTTNKLLTQCNIPINVIEADFYVDAESLGRLASLIWSELDDEASGYTNAPLRSGFFKTLCRLCITSKNLRQAIILTCNFFGFIGDEFNFSLKEDTFMACFTLAHNTKKNSDFFIVSLCIVLTRFYGRLIGEELRLTKIDFGFESFCSKGYISSIFSTEVCFNNSETRLIFPSSYLVRSPSLNIEQVKQLIGSAPDSFLYKYRGENNFVEKVKKQLLLAENLGAVDQKKIAQSLNISSATLVRKLRAYDTSFMLIKNSLRMTKSIQLLKQHKTLSEIACLLGFSEPSAFSRAFSRWTGTSPKQYLRKVR